MTNGRPAFLVALAVLATLLVPLALSACGGSEGEPDNAAGVKSMYSKFFGLAEHGEDKAICNEYLTPTAKARISVATRLAGVTCEDLIGEAVAKKGNLGKPNIENLEVSGTKATFGASSKEEALYINKHWLLELHANEHDSSSESGTTGEARQAERTVEEHRAQPQAQKVTEAEADAEAAARRMEHEGKAPWLPTQLAGARALEVRPAIIGFTGDGTGYLGGFTGARSVTMPSRVQLGWAGRLRWTSWGTREAKATGADWGDNGIPNDAQGTFYPDAVTVRAYDAVNGVFRRLARTERGQTATLRAVYDAGYWQW